MRFDVVTLFPEFFAAPLATGLVGRAFEAGRAELGFVDPRDFTTDRHRTVDDTPYGGGAGMVMKCDPLVSAIEQAKGRGGGRVLMMSPQGAPLTQARLQGWAKQEHLVLVAGRYEGFDERIRELVDEEVSLGDYVLTGGEYAALVIIDGVVRLRPGTLGNQESSETDSFEQGLLEHPHYTRPATFRDEGVPSVLTSGDHGRIATWRRQQALERTRARRPDLLAAVGLDAKDRQWLWSRPPKGPRPVLAVACDPDPEALADLATLAEAYALDAVWVVPEPGDPAALEAALATAPIRRAPLPLPPPKRRRDTPPPVEVDPRARLRVGTGWAELFAAEPRAWVALGPVSAPGATVAPAQLRGPAPEGGRWGLAVGGAELVSLKGALSEGLIGALPPLRSGTRGVALGPIARCAVALDRVLGEG